MPALRLCLLSLLLTAAPLASAFEANWAAMRTGLNRDEVARTLGVPVLRNAGRGHETWVYDAGASVQFHGGVVSAWTAPKTPAAALQPVPAPARVATQEISTPTRLRTSPRLS